VKENALLHLHLLRAEQDCQQIDALNAEYEKRIGRKAVRVYDLVQAGFLRRLPVDPVGYPYVIGPDGKAALNLNSPLLEQQLLQQNSK
jgi:hypothetical protein